ncbi:ribosome biogenesis GTPase Der [Geothermobacter hydrogeniphilus]|uniref:GTPase Der n=1 Tax=Geothermobacter hydrogeniphilus TaxID=1969733 RepID=A0A1X0YDY7_9BACT|nr:ribosome biogenesis GTPase Der [Geothermobacter hydrogeniphilus]ORJ63337.1 ribosome biogenesis GTPase Der [Geothermobacter hydrogeniphilus]
MLPVVAIVGRPNVGKSTLFNRLLGQRKAIVEDVPGVTRDRNYARVDRFDRPFMLIDTGGFEPASEDRLLTQMREQSQLAIEEADIILLVFDGREGLTPSDEEVAAMLRRVEKPVLFLVNKIDGDSQELALGEFYSLGLDDLLPISSAHGRGVGELIDRLHQLMPEEVPPRESEQETRLAVIGRPNVGKSSLINRMLGVERVVANPTAGTTRDSVDTPFVYNRKNYLMIDTAGIRRKGKVSQKLEKFSVVQALKAMERAHIVLVVIDAGEGVTDQDLTVAGYAEEKGRAVLLVVNKWDLVEKDHTTMGQYIKDLRGKFKFLPDAPVVFISALTGQRVSKIMTEVEKLSEEFNRKLSTSAINKVLQEATEAHPPSIFRGKRLKFFYATQTGVRPPTITIFVNRSDGVHFSYQRYLANQFRRALRLTGSPLRIRYQDRRH